MFSIQRNERQKNTQLTQRPKWNSEYSTHYVQPTNDYIVDN